MAKHASFTINTGIQVYFCDPHSPWQRPSNENTNGLLRQYMPKGMDLSVLTEADLDTIAGSLNNRPHKRLGFMKPSERLAEPCDDRLSARSSGARSDKHSHTQETTARPTP
jgi:IS30 family transposase